MLYSLTHYIIHHSCLVIKQLCSKPVCCLSGWCKRMILALSTPRLWWISLRFRGFFFLRKKIPYFKDEKEHPLRYSIIRQKGYILQNRRTYSSCVCIFSVYLIFLLEFWTLFFSSKAIRLFVVVKKFCLKTCSSFFFTIIPGFVSLHKNITYSRQQLIGVFTTKPKKAFEKAF